MEELPKLFLLISIFILFQVCKLLRLLHISVEAAPDCGNVPGDSKSEQKKKRKAYKNLFIY